MESRNPAFRKMGEQAGREYTPSPQQLQDMYNQPAYAPPVQPGVRTMTIDDVVVKGFLSLGTLTLTGAVAWVVDLGMGVALISALIGLGIGLYLSRGSVASAYGAAGSLIAVLLWVYYSAQIFFFGAVVTQQYALRAQAIEGGGVLPDTRKAPDTPAMDPP